MFEVTGHTLGMTAEGPQSAIGNPLLLAPTQDVHSVQRYDRLLPHRFQRRRVCVMSHGMFGDRLALISLERGFCINRVVALTDLAQLNPFCASQDP